MSIDLVGTEILSYRIVEKLGEGGMGAVWRAEHPKLGTSVAIKTLDPVLARDQELMARFEDEAVTQVKLKHPNIVQVENFSDDPLAMVMEYVQGKDLSDVIGQDVGPIPVERALPMIRQLLAAVGFAHEQGVVHRDLKPANVLLTEQDEIKVMDFGIAKVLGSSGRTRTGASMGTPAYMAPEQIRGAKDADARADIYALGVTIYEMLAGRPPFEASSDSDGTFELMEAQVHQAPPDPRDFYPGIPEAVVAVVLKAMEKAPENRFQTVNELATALEAAVNEPAADADEGIPAPPPKPSAPPTVVEPGPVGDPIQSNSVPPHEPDAVGEPHLDPPEIAPPVEVPAAHLTPLPILKPSGPPPKAIGIGAVVVLGLIGAIFMASGGEDPTPGPGPVSSPHVGNAGGGSGSATSVTSKENAPPPPPVTEPVASTAQAKWFTPDNATASSFTRCRGKEERCHPWRALDGDVEFWWQENADGDGIGEYLQVSWSGDREVTEIKLVPGLWKERNDKFGDRWPLNNRLKEITLLFSSGASVNASLPDRRGWHHVVFNPPQRATWVRVIIKGVHPGYNRKGKHIRDSGISEIQVKARW